MALLTFSLLYIHCESMKGLSNPAMEWNSNGMEWNPNNAMEMHCYVYITLISCIRNKKVYTVKKKIKNQILQM